MAMQPVGGGDASEHPFIPIGIQRGTRLNNDGTFTPVVNVTAQSALYGVQFTFTVLASNWDADVGPTLTAERANWVDEVCGAAHVQDFWTESDEGPSSILYNYAIITVGTDDKALTDEVSVRMDHLNDQATFAAIDKAWQRIVAMGGA